MAPSELLALAVNRVPFLRPLEKFRVMALCPRVEQFVDLSKADMEKPSLRFSFSKYNTRDEVDYAVTVLKEFVMG